MTKKDKFDKYELRKYIKRNWIVPLLIIKSLFHGIIQLAWGMVALGLLGWTFVFIHIKGHF